MNAALVVPAGTVTDAGTVTALLLLDKLTTSPPVGAPTFSVTVQASVPAPVIELLVQVIPPKAEMPVPVSPIVDEVPVDELLVNVSCPEIAPATVGANVTVSIAVWPGLIVSGKAAPDSENPAPLIETALIVTAAVPVDDRVSDWAADDPIETLPSARFALLIARVGVELPSCSVNVNAAEPAEAVKVAG